MQSPHPHTQKLVIITGASSGIGLALAVAFRQEGYAVANWDLKPPNTMPVTDLYEKNNDDIPWFPCDVSSEPSVQAAYALTKSHFSVPSTYCLVNNAGLQYLSPVADFPLEKWNLVISVLLTGTFLCSKTVLADMTTAQPSPEANEDHKRGAGGRIINIASVHGKLASPHKAAYVAAKHGVLGLSKTMALEVAGRGVTVNCICPGYMDTPLMRGQVEELEKARKMDVQQKGGSSGDDDVMNRVFLKGQAIKSLASLEEVASLAVWLASEKARTVTGEAWNVSGGWGMGM